MSKQHHTASGTPDGFVGFWQRKWESITVYFSRGLVLLVGLVVLIVAGWGISQYLDGRKERSTEALGRALRIADAPLITEQDKDVEQSDEVPRFKTNKERQDSALKVLADLDKDYASTPAALRATLMKASLAYDQGRYPEAESLYRRFVDAKPREQALVLLAQEGIGLCAEARSDFAAAQAAYTAQAAGDLFKERSQWNLARVYAKQGNKAKAVEIYKEMLAKGDPKSSLRDDIQNRLSQLEQ
ncbi:MAG: tetratricopeptide repeat protein [Myxococcales bacterium]|nr:tetratricopeptide repeat protein [Myxococcales bacterium]